MTTTVEWRKWNSVQTKPVINADKVRQMSEEELADFIAKALYGMLGGQPCLVGNGFEDCKNRWLDWLNREVKDEKEKPTVSSGNTG